MIGTPAPVVALARPDIATVVGAVLIGAAVVLVLAVLIGGRARPHGRASVDHDRWTMLGADDADEVTENLAGRIRDRLAPLTRGVGRRLAPTPLARRLDELLVDAGMAATVGEAITAGAVVAGVGVVIGPMGGTIGVLVAFAVVVLTGPSILLSLARTRRARFAAQLPTAIASIASSLRSGIGIVRSIDNASRKLPAPMSEELGRAIVEVRFGRDVEVALASVATRMRAPDLGWVVEVIEIQRQVGGDLAAVLDEIAATLRERLALARSIEAMTMEGKVSASVLAVLPVAIALIIGITQPGYFEPLLSDPVGIAVACGAALWAGVGIVWMRRMIAIDV